MVCSKCGYTDLREVDRFGFTFCKICSAFVPNDEKNVKKYSLEKVDWKVLECFRKFDGYRGEKQKEGMKIQIKQGHPVTRAPLGYSIVDGTFRQNEDSIHVISLFRTFLNNEYSLNSISKNFALSLNGLKKVLSNRCYLGEIKFGGKIYKSSHKPLIDNETFYAVQRKLKQQLRPRKKKFMNSYKK